MDTTIRNLDSKTYRKLRATAVLNNVTVGEAVNEAMMLWLDKKNNRKTKI